MKAFESIKNNFKPIQPSVKADTEHITYIEVKPKKEIANYVYCFWQLKTERELNESFKYRVVSDGCIDIFFDCHQVSENFVMGFCKKYTEFDIGNTFNYIGIRFLPSAFPLIFGISAKTLSNQSQRLKNTIPQFSNWIELKMNPSHSFKKTTQLLNKKLTELVLNNHCNYNCRFFKALELILQKNGFLDTEKDLDTGFSSRQLRRIFNFYIGTTAKSFSNVVRFQYILNSKPSKKSLKENKFYLDVGFFDQAHFIKNFKTFYGVTPLEAFR